MKTKTVIARVPIPRAVLGELSEAAKQLGKSRSELFREAVEAYLRPYRFRKLQQTVAKASAKRGVSVRSEDQVDRTLHELRRVKRG